MSFRCLLKMLALVVTSRLVVPAVARSGAEPGESDAPVQGAPRPAQPGDALAAPLLATAAALVLGTLSSAGPASARPRPVSLADGSAGLAYEFTVPLRVLALARSVPTDWLPLFRACQGDAARVTFATRPTLAALFSELSSGAAASFDAVTLGDAWVGSAIAAGLLSPLPKAEASRWLARLPPGWRRLLRRDAATGLCSHRGDVFAAPYRWGATLIAVRDDKPAASGVLDFADLLSPALERRVARSSPSGREALGITLRACHCSANAPSPSSLSAPQRADVAAALARLRRNTLVCDGSSYLRALACGDAWAALGPSDEILSFAQRTPGISVVFPASGSLLWADVWVLPSGRAASRAHGAGASPLLPSWHEFCAAPGRARPRMGLRCGAAPCALDPEWSHDGDGAHATARGAASAASAIGGVNDSGGGDAAKCAGTPLQGGGWPSQSSLHGSEFLLPLSPSGEAAFAALMREAAASCDADAAAKGEGGAGSWGERFGAAAVALGRGKQLAGAA